VIGARGLFSKALEEGANLGLGGREQAVETPQRGQSRVLFIQSGPPVAPPTRPAFPAMASLSQKLDDHQASVEAEEEHGCPIRRGCARRLQAGFRVPDRNFQSFRQQLSDRAQLKAALCNNFRIRHRNPFHSIHDDVGDDEPRILLIVGRDDVPGCVMSTCGVKALLAGLHVVFPVSPFVNVCSVEFPILSRLIDALKESLSLLFIRKMRPYLDSLRAVAM
jgi:hypothetical protein